MKKFLSLFAFLFISYFISAQDTISKPSCLKPYSLEVSGGMNVYSDLPLSLEEMQKLAPGSQMLQRDFSSFPPSNNAFGNTYNTNSTLSAMLSFVPYSKKEKKYKDYTFFRAGFTFTSFQIDGPSYYKRDSQRLDTLNPGSGTTIYDDSISNKFYNFAWTGQNIGIDLSQVFHTNDQRIFSFWTGYGIHLGMALNTAFRGSYSETNYKETTTMNSYPYTSFYSSDAPATFNFQNETVKTKNVFVAKIYFPIGMQIRLSRKNNFLNKLAFTSELLSSMDFQPVPGNGVMTRFYFNQSFGLKYYFQNNATK